MTDEEIIIEPLILENSSQKTKPQRIINFLLGPKCNLILLIIILLILLFFLIGGLIIGFKLKILVEDKIKEVDNFTNKINITDIQDYIKKAEFLIDFGCELIPQCKNHYPDNLISTTIPFFTFN